MPGSVLFAIFGALAFYLAAPGQRWLRSPLPPRFFRTLAAVFSIAAFVIGASGLHPATSLAIVFTCGDGVPDCVPVYRRTYRRIT